MKADQAFVKEEERRARVRPQSDRVQIPWFKIKVGDGAKVRFLWEIGDGIGLYRHNRQEKPFNVSCFRNEEYGQEDCHYCAAGDPMRIEYFWLVYNYATQQVEVLNFRDTSFTPVAHLRVFAEDNGTVMDRDITIKRMPAQSSRNDGRQVSQYLAIWAAPSTFTHTGISVPSREDVVEYLRPFELRS